MRLLVQPLDLAQPHRYLDQTMSFFSFNTEKDQSKKKRNHFENVYAQNVNVDPKKY